MKILRNTFLVILSLAAIHATAHVPFLKPSQFIIRHNRLQVESSFTEFPFKADFAMSAPYFAMVDPAGKQTTLVPAAKTKVAQYLEPVISDDGTYRIHAGLRKGPRYNAVETADGKLYFSDDMATKQGTMTKMQYYSSADTYLTKGDADYKPQTLNEGVEIIPLSQPNAIKAHDNVSFRVYENGEPVANARVVVAYDNEYYQKKRLQDLYDVENERAGSIHADEDGVFTFSPKQTGLVLLFVTVHHKVDDSLWESYNASLTLEVNHPDAEMN